MLIVGFSLLSMVIAATAAVQATPTTGDAPEIPPLVWELVEISGVNDSPVEIADPERYTVRFLPDGALAASADCNQSAGTYTAEVGMLEITLTASSLALCPPDSKSEPFLSLLASATGYEFDDDGFLVLAGGEGSLRLRGTLIGVVWEWREFRGGDGSSLEPERPEEFTLVFLPDGTLALQTDCHRATGDYAANGPAIELSIAGGAPAACPPESLAERYIDDLGEVRSHVFRDGNLYLALWADAGIMEFAARYDEPPRATPQAG